MNYVDMIQVVPFDRPGLNNLKKNPSTSISTSLQKLFETFSFFCPSKSDLEIFPYLKKHFWKFFILKRPFRNILQLHPFRIKTNKKMKTRNRSSPSRRGWKERGWEWDGQWVESLDQYRHCRPCVARSRSAETCCQSGTSEGVWWFVFENIDFKKVQNSTTQYFEKIINFLRETAAWKLFEKFSTLECGDLVWSTFEHFSWMSQ